MDTIIKWFIKDYAKPVKNYEYFYDCRKNVVVFRLCYEIDEENKG